MRAALVLLTASAFAAADQKSLDCPLRQIGLDFAQKLQPFRPLAAFQEVADALNGAEEAQGCAVKPAARAPLGLPQSAGATSGASSRVLSYPLPTSGLLVFADPSPARGSDATGTGSEAAPFRSIVRAIAAVRAARAAAGVTTAALAPRATIVLRRGVFHLSEAISLTPDDSQLTIQSYPGEEAAISGTTVLTGVTWKSTPAPPRPAFDYRPGGLAAGFDVMAAGSYTIDAALTMCTGMPACAAISFNSSSPRPSGAITVSFKSAVFYSRSNNAGTYVKNVGYGAGQTQNLLVADLSGVALAYPVEGLRVSGTRGIRARYPNSGTAELLGAMQIVADRWIPQPQSTKANETFNPASPLRDTAAQGYFQTFRIGIGGPCAERFTPQAGYWCATGTQGGGPGPYQAPVGMIVSNANSSLPHTPYTHSPVGAAVHSWRSGRWFSWVFGVGASSYNAATHQTTFNFTSGGNQGSRGGNAGQEFFIENVLDELDAPGEWFYDSTAKQLYLWHNASSGAPADGTVELTQLHILVNQTGTKSNPVVGVSFLGVTFQDSAPFFLGPHGTPSGGDWAVERSGAVFLEGTTGAVISGCLLTRLDGNAVFVSGFNRATNISFNEFVWIGETAVSQWGYTDGSPVPGLGFDATTGNQPRGTYVGYNFVHEVGVWTKQNSFYFQAESFENHIIGNIAFNGPRAGVNFNDGMGGGSILEFNVLFNFCRESSDHGPFNSWDRQVYIYDLPNGTATVIKQNDSINNNWILANYHSSMALDDGSCYYLDHHNVLISASEGAAYGGSSLKADFGGHDVHHYANLDLFWSTGFGICPQLAGHEEAYYSNYLYMGNDGAYGSGQTCSGAGKTIVYNNTIWSPKAAITECGTSLANWQAQGNDVGTTASTYPPDATVLAIARSLLGL